MAQAKPILTTDELWANAALAPNKQKPTIGKIANGWAYGEKPPHNEFNWFFGVTTQMFLHQQENGVAEWSAGIVYTEGALAWYNSKIYQSLQNLNENHTPPEVGWWEEFQGSGGGGGGFLNNFYDCEFTATAGQTTFLCNYNPNWVQVCVSGICLSQTEYTATDGANVILNVPANEGDIVQIHSIEAGTQTGGSTFTVDFDSTDGQTDFTVPGVYTSLKVYTNGVRNRSNEYFLSDDGTNTTVTFINGRHLDDWVLIEN